ncbi:hypothetical protein BRADI_1g75692v3 [Brachypodium distachyon]|uniref:Peptidase A1 domain-containing protein n=1 Tax=Brachypodium distachyon TaxID=15368 RepID=A0A2K2DVC9_BRADI|nr:hypothetical protein BRADI_1g75692v3 [Brachypodium distachyon]
MSSCTNDCPSSTFDHVINSDGALEFPLFHRDHPCILNHLNHPRSSGFSAKKDLPIDLIQDDQINNFLFLMPIKLGTPPVRNLVAVDTGSTLSFVQCEPCLSCHDQGRAGQIFALNKSESLGYVGCSEESCRTVQSALRLQSKACLYSMTFGGASTYSVGKLVTDRLAIGQNNSGYTVPNFLFGCSLDTEYHQHEAGVFGFGAESFSFFEQLAPLVGYKAFSYCWPSDKRQDTCPLGSTTVLALLLTPPCSRRTDDQCMH